MRRASCALLLFALSLAAYAHPHLYVDVYARTAVYQEGIDALEMEWYFSESYGRRLIGKFDADADGTLSAAEQAALRGAAFDNLRRFGYFTHVEIGGEAYEPTEIERFEAAVERGRLRYRFAVLLGLRAGREATIAVYDETGYATFALRYLEDPPAELDGLRLEARVLVDMDMFCAAQPTGQRKIVLSVDGPEAAEEAVPASLAPVPADRPPRDVTNDDPFLSDQRLFSGLSADNPFMSY